MRSQPSRTLNLYKSYSFVDKDPVVDLMRTAIQTSGASYQSIHERSDVSVSTLYSWFHQKVKTPRMATIAAVGSVLGFSGYNWEERQFIGAGNSSLDIPKPKLRIIKGGRGRRIPIRAAAARQTTPAKKRARA